MSDRVRLILSGLLLAIGVVLALMGYLTEPPEAIIQWSTESEVETAGFHVYRSASEAGPYERVTEALIVSSGDPFSGASYEFRDNGIERGKNYFYQLEELETNGNFTRLPDVVRFEGQSGVMGWAATLNWNLLTLLLGALALLWLLPGPRRIVPDDGVEPVHP